MTLNKNTTRGITLIEVLIALLIGVGLTLSATKIFIQSKKNYQMQLAASEISNNANYANYVLEKYTRISGYRKLPADEKSYNSFDNLFPCGMIGGTNHDGLAECEAFTAEDNGEEGLVSDTLLIYFQADTDLMQCNNTGLPSDAINSGDIILFRFSVVNKQLRCLTHNITTNEPIGSEITLLDHVLSFQVLYGLGNESKQIERYVPISFPGLSTPSERNHILAIRVGMLLESFQSNIKRQSSNPEFIEILDTKRAYPDENRLYFLLTNTVQLRNSFDGIVIP